MPAVHALFFTVFAIEPWLAEEVARRRTKCGAVLKRLPLPPGARIAVIAPCGPPHLENTRAGLGLLREWGYRPVLGTVVASYVGDDAVTRPELDFLAASDHDRREELRWGLAGDFDACWVVRGGHGLLRLLDAADSVGPPRPVLGFSDVTCLLWALQRRGWPDLVHAPNVQTLPRLGPQALDALRSFLVSGVPSPMHGVEHQPGEATGELCGGNLCVLACLCGTPQQLDCRERILFLEDINEAPYRMDRLLTQLAAAGCLDGLRGLVLGSFTGCGDPTAVLRHWEQRLGVPVLAEVAAGHCDENYPLLLGATVSLRQGSMVWVPRSTSSGAGGSSL